MLSLHIADSACPFSAAPTGATAPPIRMTQNDRVSSRNRPTSAAPFRVRPAAVLVIVLVLAVFVTGLVIGGATGAVMVGALAVLAGGWLALRWTAIDPRVRMIRLVAVLATLAIAISLFARR